MVRVKPGWPAYIWVYTPLLSAAACAGLFVYLLVFRRGPSEPRLLLEVANAVAVLLAVISFGSVRYGEKLLAEVSQAEPITLKEAGWNLGVGPGLLAGVIAVLHVQAKLDSSFMQAYGAPLFLYAAIVSLMWATLTRLIARRHRLTLSDYACGVFMPRGRYKQLARAKQAWQQARAPLHLKPADAQEWFPEIVLPLAYHLAHSRNQAVTDHLVQLLTELREQSVLPLLKQGIRDDSPVVRRWTCAALGPLPFKGASKLLEACQADPDATVRSAAEQALNQQQG